MTNFLSCKSYFCIFLLLFFAAKQFNLEGGIHLDQGLSDIDKMIYQFIDGQGKLFGKKYELRQCGNSLGGMDKLNLMGLSFEKIGSPVDEKEARYLMISLTEDFLEAINNNEKLKPLLENYPFTAKNLNMDVLFFNSDRTEQIYPNICCVGNHKGKICFLTTLPEKKEGYYTEKYEKYEEAVSKLKENFSGL